LSLDRQNLQAACAGGHEKIRTKGNTKKRGQVKERRQSRIAHLSEDFQSSEISAKIRQNFVSAFVLFKISVIVTFVTGLLRLLTPCLRDKSPVRAFLSGEKDL